MVTPYTMRGSMTHGGESQAEALGQIRSLVHPKERHEDRKVERENAIPEW